MVAVVSEAQTTHSYFPLYFPLTETGIRGPAYFRDKYSGPTPEGNRMCGLSWEELNRILLTSRIVVI